MQHNWYAVITAKVLLDKTISSTQKLLIALIANLSNEKGYCFATNRYLGECFGISERQVQSMIMDLETRKYLGRVMKLKKNGDLDHRALTILEPPIPLKKTSPPPLKKSSYPPP